MSNFQGGDTKLERFLEKKSISSKEIIIFCELIYLVNFLILYPSLENLTTKIQFVPKHKYWTKNYVFEIWNILFVNISAAKLPEKMTYGPRMSQTPDGTSLILSYENKIHQLKCQAGRKCTWETQTNRLKIKRQYHIQATVPVQNC